MQLMPADGLDGIDAEGGSTYTTICLRASRGLRMNLRVRRVTGASAMFANTVSNCHDVDRDRMSGDEFDVVGWR